MDRARFSKCTYLLAAWMASSWAVGTVAGKDAVRAVGSAAWKDDPWVACSGTCLAVEWAAWKADLSDD